MNHVKNNVGTPAICLGAFVLLAIAGPPSTSAQSWNFERVVTTDDFIPGTTQTFPAFDWVSLRNGNIAFRTYNHGGVYKLVNGSLSKVAAVGDSMPGNPYTGGQKLFYWVGKPGIDSDGSVALHGTSPPGTAWDAVYLNPPSGGLTQVATEAQSMPNAPTQFYWFDDFVPIRNARVVFRGEGIGQYSGIYSYSSNTLECVA